MHTSVHAATLVRGVALPCLLAGVFACAPSAFDRAPDGVRDASVEPAQDNSATSPADAGIDAAAATTRDASTSAEAAQTVPPDAASSSEAGPPADVPVDAGADSAAPICDVQNDPQNCGSCGKVCSAVSSASATCTAGRCGHLCTSGTADCDGDLEAPGGNGCEISLSESALHCGTCNIRCDAPTGGLAACEKRSCVGYVPHVGAPTAESNVPHGNGTTGGAFDLLCGVDEVLTGFDTRFEYDRIYALSAQCARITTTGTRAQPKLIVGTSHASPLIGAFGIAQPPVASFPCPTGKVVTAIEGTLWYGVAEAEAAGHLSVKQLILTCSELSVDSAGKFSALNSSIQWVGNNVGAVQQTFTDSCSAGSAVVGFKMRAGAWIDQVHTQCGALRVDRAATSSHVKGVNEL